MPIALDVDWPAIQSAVESGKLLAEVSRMFGVSYGAIKKRAFREKWLSPSLVTNARKKHLALSPPVPKPDTLAILAAESPEMLRNHHTERTRRILNKVWGQVEACPPTVDSIGDLEKVDKMTRLNEGMSTGEPQAVMQVLLGAQTDLRSSQAEVVELEDCGEIGEGEAD